MPRIGRVEATQPDPKDLIGADVYEFEVEPKTGSEDEETNLQATVAGMIEEAKNWKEENVEPAQEKATKYYKKEPFGTEEKGRSQVISSDVRDTVKGTLPSLMRIFFGPEQAVEFKPRFAEDVEGAAQMTDYINLVIREDNPGFRVTHSVFKDALVRKEGIIKWWWEEPEVLEGDEYTGLDEASIMLLEQDENVEVEVGAEDEEGTYTVYVTRYVNEGRARFGEVPPEEFIYSPNARDLESAALVGHIRDVPANELIAMGIDAKTVDEHKGRTSDLGGNQLASARRHDGGVDLDSEDEQLDATRPVQFAEVWVFVDPANPGDEERPEPVEDDIEFEKDGRYGDDVGMHDESTPPVPVGEGLIELRKISCIGDAWEIVKNEAADERPFAYFCPDPEPHTIVGLSQADDVMDVQLVKSTILRKTLDSLNLALAPQQEAVEGEVNVADLLNPEIGNVVRVRRPGMLREIKHDFVGRESLPILQYMDEKKENSTGMSKAAMGLDAGALQSSTQAAVGATISGAQQHVEMIARIFAETGMKRFYKGLLRLLHKHQDRARIVRLRNKFVPIDPKSWDVDMDVVVNVALGAGTQQEKLQTIGAISQMQQQLMSSGAPIVGWPEIRASLARMAELAGWKNSDEFWKPWGAEEEQEAAEAAAQQPPPPDPMQMALQIEQQKVQMEMQMKQMELALKREEMVLKDDRERDKLARESALKEQEIEAEFNFNIEDAKLRAAVERDRAAMDADVNRKKAEQEAQAAAAQPTPQQ